MCPACPDTLLTMSERQGVEIDYCPKCRGVWLDRGELDKIIEKSFAAEEQKPQVAQPVPQPQVQQQQPYPQQPMYPPHDPHYVKYDKYGRPKRRKSFLEELFD